MARLIKHTAVGPVEVPASEKSTWVCMCGLSKDYPRCDGSHKLAKQQEAEGKVYCYDGDAASEVTEPGVTREL